MIIARYLTKEILWSLVAILGVLLLIAISDKFVHYLAKAATGELPTGFVFQIVALYIPELLSLILPLSLFIAILLVYGRMHVNSEMMVLFTSGMSWATLTRITLKLALMFMVLEGVLTLGCVPLLEEYRAHIIAEGEAVGVMQAMIPGRFQSTSDGKIVFYLENVSARGQIIEGVFIAERPATLPSETNNWIFITAESAKLRVEKNAQASDYFLVLNQGHRYEGKPGKADFTVLQFEEYGREIEQKPAPVPRDFLKYKSSVRLWHSEDLKDQGELQLRLSMALSVFLLALLAIPLSYVHPRQGRFSKFLPAILIFIVYYNGFTVAKRWVAIGWVPSWIGVWWIHILVFLLAIAYLAKVSGWWTFYVSHPKNRRIVS